MNLSWRIYKWLLIAYPSEYRREYGGEMARVFRDGYRYEARRNRHLALVNYWCRTIVDLVVTAVKERGEDFGKDRRIMNNRSRDLIALLGTIVIIAVALFLHRWAVSSVRSGGFAAIVPVGFALDAFVTAGIISNLNIFLLVKVTKWDSLRIALWTFLIVHVALLIVIAIIAPRIGPPVRFGLVLFGYVVSFVIWFGLHWTWRSMRPEVANS